MVMSVATTWYSRRETGTPHDSPVKMMVTTSMMAKVTQSAWKPGSLATCHSVGRGWCMHVNLASYFSPPEIQWIHIRTTVGMGLDGLVSHHLDGLERINHGFDLGPVRLAFAFAVAFASAVCNCS